ncbi:hypothetical protein [Gordonia zhaorongruii]|uniref:hypothetical protein n=1 Tax=Gordonia zhaorongruii TaxID=2597659 RepID=UPI00104C2272|nr:hypothetical protein [Gordonia zhaorongruii]
MDELKCLLSPLVFTELYTILGEHADYRDALDRRLDRIGYRIDWLPSAAEAYGAKWEENRDDLTPESADESGLPAEHSILATWLLACLRNYGDSYTISAELQKRVLTRLATEVPALAAHRPASLSPIIRGWTLGLVTGDVDPLYPVVPALPLQDSNIWAAYCGLIQHVLHLGAVSEPWPELAGTAVYVRTGGLAEALSPLSGQPGQRGLNHSINTLMADTKRQVPPHINAALARNWVRWVERRNVLTHVVGAEASDSFEDSAQSVCEWSQVGMTIIGITQFVCQEISQEQFDSTPSALRTDPWGYLQRDLTVW